MWRNTKTKSKSKYTRKCHPKTGMQYEICLINGINDEPP